MYVGNIEEKLKLEFYLVIEKYKTQMYATRAIVNCDCICTID